LLFVNTLTRWRVSLSAERPCYCFRISRKTELILDRLGYKSTDEKVGLSQKEESDLTERWIFGIPTSTDCLCSSTVTLYFVSMKELTLMNSYHQTQGRPKPPVEHRLFRQCSQSGLISREFFLLRFS
jgi:hypothetical protein